VKRSNLAFPEEIATHLSGARNDKQYAHLFCLSLALGDSIVIPAWRESFWTLLYPSMKEKREGSRSSRDDRNYFLTPFLL
jgi:hypothetical protein